MAFNTTTKKPILLLGAGELGLALLSSLLAHPRFSPTLTPLTLTLRPSTLSNPPSALDGPIASKHITLLGLDLTAPTTTTSTLAAIFRNYECIIHASGMNLPRGTQRKVTDAVLEAGVPRYVPWQFGVDYDVLGPEAGGGLFAEQCGIREVLRGQGRRCHHEGKSGMTRWLVVSCGIFMSFLVGEGWGVVERGGTQQHNSDKADAKEAVKVRALGSWQDGITVTDVEDIAKVTAELVLGDGWEALWEERNKVFIAGQTLSYEELAAVVKKVTGKPVVKELWDIEFLQGEMRKDPGNVLWKYRVVFGGGEGVSWSKEGTWNDNREMVMEGVEEWLKRNWRD